MIRWNAQYSFVGLVCGALMAVGIAHHSESPAPDSWPKAERAGSSIVTLWASDDLASAYPSGRLTDGLLDLRQSVVLFDRVKKGALSFGFLGESLVSVHHEAGPLTVPPVKDPRNPSPRIGPSVFHSLRIDRKRLVYDTGIGKPQELRDASRVWRQTPRARLVHIAPKVGDIIVLRHQPAGARSPEQSYKFLVLDHRPGVSMTLRVGAL